MKNKKTLFLAISFFILFFAWKDSLAYNLCAIMESGYITGLENNACPGSAKSPGIGLQKKIEAASAKITKYNIPRANTGQNYSAYLETDSRSKDINWDIKIDKTSFGCNADTTCTDNLCGGLGFWSNNWNNLPNPLTAKATAVPGQFKIDFGKAGKTGICFFTADLKEGDKIIDSKDFYIITNPPPAISALPYSYTASSSVKFKYTFTASSPDTNTYPLVLENNFIGLDNWVNSFAIDRTKKPLINKGSLGLTPHGNEYIYTLSSNAINSGNARITEKENIFTGKIKVSDRFGNYSEFLPNIKIINNPPVITSENCKTTNNVYCLIKASDIDNNAITLSIPGLPSWLKLVKSLDSGIVSDLETCPPNYHKDEKKCIYNIDYNANCAINNAAKTAKRYDEATKAWGKCEVVSCREGYAPSIDNTECKN